MKSESRLFQPQLRPDHPLADMKRRQQAAQQWTDGQMAGRRWAVACVSLEITQRCNLDCTLCYLSDHSEAVRDIPMAELMRRIDMIHAHYGPGTDVQVSGGEPTLRAQPELVEIVRTIASRGMRPALLTNGIRASRSLLVELAAAGLTDVAFHVDTTQLRAGYADEAALNTVRLEYMARAHGLPVNVMFNTTVHDGNWGCVAMLARFFVDHADQVRFASFQLQAETGRGVLGAREDHISLDAIWKRLEAGAGTPLSNDVLLAGHSSCNRGAVMLVAAGQAHDAFGDRYFVQRFMREISAAVIDRRTRGRAVRTLFDAALRRPALALAGVGWLLRQARAMRAALWRSRGRVHKLTFFTHNFMDAQHLDEERVNACVFMAVTQDGPMSMCAYNARRNDYLLRPLEIAGQLWQPLRTGDANVHTFPIKLLKGRVRARRQRTTQSVA